MIRLVIVDDHEMVRAGIRGGLPADIEPVGEAADVQEAVRTIGRTDPDVVLLDLQFIGNRPEFAALEKLVDAGQPVIVYSHMLSDEVILTCLDLGAVTYLTKNEGRNHLVAAVHAAHSSHPYVGPRMAKALLADETFGRTGLTEREKEVLTAWFQTENKELVAKRLFTERLGFRVESIYPADAPVVDNGSGLSRDERITPEALGALLRQAAQHPQGAAFVQSLAVAGVSGTAQRIARDPRGPAHANAGYVNAANGARYAVVGLINHPNASAARPALEALVEWVAAQPD